MHLEKLARISIEWITPAVMPALVAQVGFNLPDLRPFN